MKPDLSAAIHLLHRSPFGALATHSAHMPGYPFASALPFVPDEAHCPVFLLSGLAEHTKNLLASPRASLLVTAPKEPQVLEGQRMTMVGDVSQFEASPEMRARYVRYHPEASQYLALGDFLFFRLTPNRIRYIGGFAQMGWVEQHDWGQTPVLPLHDEAKLLRGLLGDIPAGVHLLGIDCHGIDIIRSGERERLHYREPLAPGGDIGAAVKRLLAVL
ncbi:pyridoxamine 5'-phosphate oxidase [Herbaspirillum sp. HC18]|nr:pyridoxamine 5'-phosphate oxidase [Herbaspirillum sp. HC18]